MAKTAGPYRIGLDQIIDELKSRETIPCTMSLDVALGGGMPRGATVLIAGKEKLGKTTLCLQYGANAQRLFGAKVFYFNIEGRLTSHVTEQITGLQTSQDKFEVIMGPPIFNADGKRVGNKKLDAGQWWTMIGQCITDSPGSVIVVDSIANMATDREIAEGMGYQGRGDKNKFESQFARLYGDMVIANEVTLFLITQLQANTSGYGAAQQMKVGNQIKYQADAILYGTSAKKWEKKDGRILGHDMCYTIIHSPNGPPHVDVEIPLRYGTGIDLVADTINHAINWGLIERAGAWYKIPFVNQDEEMVYTEIADGTDNIKLQGEVNVRNFFIKHESCLRTLETTLRARIF
ncbi:MAG: ATPase domain-containing protein [Clostridia bacterium]|jgi:recombination protein RecA